MSAQVFGLYNGSNACYFNAAIQLLSRCTYNNNEDVIVKYIRYLETNGSERNTNNYKQNVLDHINKNIRDTFGIEHSYELTTSDVNTEITSLMINLMTNDNKKLFTKTDSDSDYRVNYILYCVGYRFTDYVFDNDMFTADILVHNKYSLCYTDANTLRIEVTDGNGNNYKLTSVVYNPGGHFITYQCYNDRWYCVNDNIIHEVNGCVDDSNYIVYHNLTSGRNFERSVLALYQRISESKFESIKLPQSMRSGLKDRMSINADNIFEDERIATINSVIGNYKLGENVNSLITKKVNKLLEVQYYNRITLADIVTNVILEYQCSITYVTDIINIIITIPDFINWFINYRQYFSRKYPEATNGHIVLYNIIISNVGKNNTEYHASTTSSTKVNNVYIDGGISIIATGIANKLLSEPVITVRKIAYYFNDHINTIFRGGDINEIYNFQFDDEVIYFNPFAEEVQYSNGYTKFKKLSMDNSVYDQMIYIKTNAVQFNINYSIIPKYDDILNYYKNANKGGTYLQYLDRLINKLLKDNIDIELTQDQEKCLKTLNIPMLILYLTKN